MKKHAVLVFISSVLMSLFVFSRSDMQPMHAWNRAFADVSLLYLAVIILLGPLSRIFTSIRKLIPWRRTVGIWAALTAIAHVLIIFNGWIEWKFERLFFIFTPVGGDWIIHPGFALANLIGIIGLVYFLLLLATSNNKSKILLGKKAWKYVQSKATTLYLLVVLHTVYFLFLHFTDHSNWLRIPFIILVSFILLFQIVGFIFFVKRDKRK
ncbi:ferric reductase-like transmembrane domain-containing protein [Bacillus alkalisoli]|uniref:ferric reductase-like transmembrane domain-containing protein n=1 Tax=Bacillus alkalisoli TaxID=2011008 RepID=UPI000C24C959|nr:ferric reductase-like transmembrane domain-containing protein [Bacillus alkalisoli]